MTRINQSGDSFDIQMESPPRNPAEPRRITREALKAKIKAGHIVGVYSVDRAATVDGQPAAPAPPSPQAGSGDATTTDEQESQ